MVKQNMIFLAIGVLMASDGEICLNNREILGLLFVYNSFSILHFLMEDEYHLV